MKRTQNILIGLILLLVVISIFILVYTPTQTKQEETVVIGAVLPLTGLEARQGDLIKNGILMAEEEINQETKHIKIVIEDSKSNPKEALNAYKILKEVYDAKFILTLGSPMAMTLSPVVNKDKVFLFAIAAAPAYDSLQDYTFRVVPSAEKEGKDLAKFLYDILQIEEVAIIYLTSDYGVGTKNSFIKPYQSKGGNILIEEGFDPTSTDFKTQLIKIKAKNPPAIYIASWGKQAGIIAKQAKELGLNIPLLCGQACQNPDLITEGREAVEGLIYPYTYLDRKTQFYYDYFKNYGEETTQISERMYDTVRLITEVTNRCEDNKNNTCLLEELSNIQFEGSSSKIMFDPYGNVIENFVLYIVKNGKFELYEQ